MRFRTLYVLLVFVASLLLACVADTDTTTRTASRHPAITPAKDRLQISGMDPPEKGQAGYLGFEIRAPWMKGRLQMRFPESLHSSRGLHFIDHHRPDMPPLYKLEPFPKWKREPDTGQISYHCKMPDGLEMSGRVRPGKDEISMEFSIKNNSNKPVDNVSPNMCLVLTHSDDFNKKHDLSDVRTWIDGLFTSFDKLTPTSKQKGRFPWPLVLTREWRKKYQGSKDYKDGAWIVDQIADLGTIARLSEDKKHLVAVQWSDRVWLMTNTSIPCLHAGPRGAVNIPPGKKHTWQGKIYLMPNDPPDLRKRYLKNAARWASLSKK